MVVKCKSREICTQKLDLVLPTLSQCHGCETHLSLLYAFHWRRLNKNSSPSVVLRLKKLKAVSCSPGFLLIYIKQNTKQHCQQMYTNVGWKIKKLRLCFVNKNQIQQHLKEWIVLDIFSKVSKKCLDIETHGKTITTARKIVNIHNIPKESSNSVHNKSLTQIAHILGILWSVFTTGVIKSPQILETNTMHLQCLIPSTGVI